MCLYLFGFVVMKEMDVWWTDYLVGSFGLAWVAPMRIRERNGNEHRPARMDSPLASYLVPS